MGNEQTLVPLYAIYDGPNLAVSSSSWSTLDNVKWLNGFVLDCAEHSHTHQYLTPPTPCTTCHTTIHPETAPPPLPLSLLFPHSLDAAAGLT